MVVNFHGPKYNQTLLGASRPWGAAAVKVDAWRSKVFNLGADSNKKQVIVRRNTLWLPLIGDIHHEIKVLA